MDARPYIVGEKIQGARQMHPSSDAVDTGPDFTDLEFDPRGRKRREAAPESKRLAVRQLRVFTSIKGSKDRGPQHSAGVVPRCVAHDIDQAPERDLRKHEQRIARADHFSSDQYPQPASIIATAKSKGLAMASRAENEATDGSPDRIAP